MRCDYYSGKSERCPYEATYTDGKCKYHRGPFAVLVRETITIKSDVPADPELKTLLDAAKSPTPRKFETGATRDSDSDKPDYEGFLSPLVIERFGEYMTKHRKQADGGLRDSDNWQKGIPLVVYAKSAWRHFLDFWKLHRGYSLTIGRRVAWSGGDPRETQDIEEVLCALLFNTQGYLHEVIKRRLRNENPPGVQQ